MGEMERETESLPPRSRRRADPERKAKAPYRDLAFCCRFALCITTNTVNSGKRRDLPSWSADSYAGARFNAGY